MKGELKAGGLALVIRSSCSSDIGKSVTLIQMLHPGEMFRAPDGTPCRWAKDRPVAWLVSGDLSPNVGDEAPRYHGWAMFKPSSLLPIDGDDHHEPDQLAKDKPAERTA